jgi:hypothetical protein
MSTTGQGGTGGGGSQNNTQFNRALARLNRDIGDYHNLMEDTLETLKKSDSYYGKLELRMQSMLKNAIDMKDIEEDMLKSKQKQAASSLVMKELQKKQSTEFQTQLTAIEAAYAAAEGGDRTELNNINQEINRLRDAEDEGNLSSADADKLAILSAIMANKQHENRIDLLK